MGFRVWVQGRVQGSGFEFEVSGLRLGISGLAAGFRVKRSRFRAAWTPKVCKIMAFMAILGGLGLLFYILLRFRWGFRVRVQSWNRVVSGLGLRAAEM